MPTDVKCNQETVMLDHLAEQVMKSLLNGSMPIWQIPQKSYQVAFEMLDERRKHIKRLAELDEPKTPLVDWLVNGQISVRTRNSLFIEGIEYAEQLSKLTERQLLKIPNLGRKSVNELIEVMEAKGFKLQEIK